MLDTGWPEALPRPGNERFPRVESVSTWFAVYRLGPRTYALVEPCQFEEVISYLILGDQRAVLFDTGMGIANIRLEIERLTDLPVLVVNSHSHYDHVGDNHRFDEVWAFGHDAEVAAIERGLDQTECSQFLPPGSYLELPPGFDPRRYHIRPSPVTHRLQHLETIELGGRTLTVYHTPGHSPGGICLLDSRDGLLLTGDTYYPGVLYAHFDGCDLQAYVQSVGCLVQLLDRVSHLCPAHGEAYAPKEVLVPVYEGLLQIEAGEAEYVVEDSVRLYSFPEFAITLPDPADA